MSIQLIWLRNDLRLTDHPAIYGASNERLSTDSNKSVTHHNELHIVVTLTPEQWGKYDESTAKQSLRLALIQALVDKSATKDITFHLLHLNAFSDCAPALLDLCQALNCHSIWWQSELPYDERQRDAQVEVLLGEHNINVHSLAPDILVSQPVLNGQGLPFKVFTPFYRRWLDALKKNHFYVYPDALPNNCNNGQKEPPKAQLRSYAALNTLLEKRHYRDDLWPANYTHIKESLNTFCETKASHYKDTRDFPAISGTSLLSPYLSLGAIGPRELLSTLRDHHNKEAGEDWTAGTWLKELAWRDFYRQLMWQFPHLSKRKAFKPETERIVWLENKDHFQAWCDGQTGFPIVDAAMRQLKQTGWMHNRLRMITASFLTKLLFMDWRKGEAYFMSQLIDGEFAANNGGWQWSASTGCDAAPYFRVFNPTRQSETYDKKGKFIRFFVPELQHLSDKDIHKPTPEQCKKTRYPEPIIDYKSARAYAIEAFAHYTRK
ncbi:cryptochrome/photolyase family protein [Marinomonas balearica]|uniref:Deoxyribodipyrimidine photo-lyase n=1 Tax=Marinomonas balearica TaxID=491947 RepID=A0A4R6M9V0_9GAMM|nr:FAD-binding domain-containing protein [Marinomonas balearica]TDO98223.1 deoxyribodipyrimidine photo-lyase [Marinomonas balearica]